YTEDGTTITLTGYTGSSTDVVIPTAQDLGFDESYTAQISKEVLQSVANNKTSLSTSTNGKKIVVSSTDLIECFAYKASLTTMDLSNLDTSNVTNMASMFWYCSGLTSLDLSHFDTSNVTGMGTMFYNCSSLTSLDLSHFDTSNVTNVTLMFGNCSKLRSINMSNGKMSNGSVYMFSGCSGLTSLDLTHLDTSNMTTMGGMFSGCSGLTSLDLSHFDTSNVTNMGSMFANCSGLTSLDLSHFDTSNVTNMGSMFANCSGLTSLDLSHLDTSNVTNMNGMFANCSGLTSLDLSHLDTSNVTNMSEMFYNCSGLTTLDLSSWNCDKVTSNGYMFKTSASTPLLVKTTDTKLKNYNYASNNRTKLGKVKIAAENGKFEGDVQELSLFDYTTDKDLTEAGVTSQLTTRKKALIPNEGYMFKEWTPEATYTTFAEKAGGTYTAEVKQADWEWTYSSTNNVVTLTKYIGESKDVVIPTAKDCGHEGATAKISKEVLQQAVGAVSVTSFTTSDNGDKIVVSSTNLSHCFASKRRLTTMDLSNLDTSKVTTMYQMFTSCKNLTRLDVSNWDTSNVTNMSGMFSSCINLTSLDVSHWDTSNVTNMAYMFQNCSGLTSLDVSHWDTSNVTDMTSMFYNCSGLTTLDLSSWNCDKVTNNGSMFRTSDSTPLLVKTTDTKLKNYNYASDNRTKLGKVKIAAENGKFEGDVQELALFDAYTTDQAFNDELVNSQLEARKDQLVLADWVKFKKWTAAATYTTFAEKAGGTYTASITHGDWKWTYDSTNEIVTLTEYIGESKDVVIPTAKDCGHEGATAKISKEVLQQAAAGANSLTTSNDGDKIVVSSTDLSRCFEGYAT
ncbi:BspA family leucine-rich repeat surface protein, partial [Enterococcus faecium]|nr:BspA family leucine-rich repeat surface protein [Enterococcus faecium]